MNGMNLKIDKSLPSVPQLPHYYSLTHAPAIDSLILYGHSKPQQVQQQQPKKKFAFKIDKKTQSLPASEELLIYNMKSNIWKTQTTTGKIPVRREQWQSLLLGNTLLVYSGKTFTTPQKLVNDMNALNIVNWTWKKLFTLENPATHEQSLLIKLNDLKALLVTSQQIWTYSIQNVNWNLPSQDLSGALWQKIPLEPSIIPLAAQLMNPHTILLAGTTHKQASTLVFSIINLSQSQSILLNVNFPEPSPSIDKIITLALPFSNKGPCLLLNKQTFFALSIDQTSINLNHELTLSEIPLSHLLTTEQRQNYALSQCQLIYFELQQQGVNEKEVESEQQSQNTARQLQPHLQSCIHEESQQESALYSRQEDDEQSEQQIQNRKNMSKNNRNQTKRDQIHSNKRQAENYLIRGKQEQKIRENHKEKHQRQQKSHSMSRQKQNRSPIPDFQPKLQQILAHQHIKRSLLEQKASLLQTSIKRAQRLVLTLCRYSPVSLKQSHIHKIKNIQQSLQTIWNRQISLRREIESHQHQIDLETVTEKWLLDDRK